MPAPAPCYHPQPDDDGNRVLLRHPSEEAGLADITCLDAAITFLPGRPVSGCLNGVAIRPWTDVPRDAAGWNALAATTLTQPPFVLPAGKRAAAGTVMLESDGRVWLAAPSNQFGGYVATFTKGRTEPGLSLQATAIKETFEESGLQAQLVAFLGDFARTQTYTRFYLARRVAGTPADMGWETQAVHLVPCVAATAWLNRSADHDVLAAASVRWRALIGAAGRR